MYSYYGDEFKVECPTGSGQYMNLYQVSEELANRMGAIYLRNHEGRRPVYGGMKKFADDPHWRDHLLFHEYFHGDNGAGLGASHQTGWTANIPSLMQLFAMITPEMLLRPVEAMAELGRHPGATRPERTREPPAALPGQHARVPAGARDGAGARRDAGRRPGRLHRRCRGEGVHLGVVPRRVADRRRSDARCRARTRVARRVPSRAARLARPGHHRLAVRDHGLQGPRRLRRRHGAAPPAPAAGASRAQAAARLRAQSHRARSPLGHRAPGVLRPRQRRRSGARAAELRARRAADAGERAGSATILAYGRDPYFAGWPDTFQLNYRHAGFREAQLRRAGRGRRPLRRRALRHGDAAAARDHQAHVGRPRAAARRLAAAGRSVLARGDQGDPPPPPAVPVHRRGVLGHGVRAAAGGLRLHVRQAALRPAARGRRRAGARTPVGRRRVTRTTRCASSRTTTSHARPRRSFPRRSTRRRRSSR